MHRPARHVLRHWQPAAAVLLFAVHAVLLAFSARTHFVTLDEAMHLAAGVHDWATTPASVYRVNPPLVRMVATIPVMLAGVATAPEPTDAPGARPEMPHARDFARANADRYTDLVFLARLAGIAWSLLGAWIVYHWASAMFGALPGLLALGLWCFDPNILGHAALLTNDVPSAVAGVGATYGFWRYLACPSWQRALLAGGLLGLALLTKFTLLILVPIWLVLWLLSNARAMRSAWSERALATVLRPSAGHAALVIVASLVVLNAGYGCHGTGRPLGEFAFVSRTLAGYRGSMVAPTNRFSGTWLASLPIPVPADYLVGIDVQRRDFELRPRSYLAGVWQKSGWWYYYLYGLAIKVPIGFSVLAIWGLFRSLRRGDRISWADRSCILVPPLVILVFISLQTGFSHHVRYVLPIYPFVMIAASRIVEPSDPRARWTRVAATALFAWGAVSSLAVYPHSLSYFNETVGGPRNGGRHLVDSNIDWGQDLLHLKSWLADHPEARPFHLAYFGSVDPHVAGIEYELPPASPHSITSNSHLPPAQRGPRPGYFAVSVSFLYGLSFSCFDGRRGLVTIGPEDFEYFRELVPIDRAGYSINIYYLSADDADALRASFALPPLQPARSSGP